MAGSELVVPESRLEKTEHGLVSKGEGWFVLNMRDAVWRHVDGRGAVCVAGDDFEGERQLEQLGVNPFVLRPGEPNAMYHRETEQFLAASSRHFQTGGPWGYYTVDETARRHGACPDVKTQDTGLAYARVPPSQPTRYRDGSLP